MHSAQTNLAQHHQVRRMNILEERCLGYCQRLTWIPCISLLMGLCHPCVSQSSMLTTMCTSASIPSLSTSTVLSTSTMMGGLLFTWSHAPAEHAATGRFHPSSDPSFDGPFHTGLTVWKPPSFSTLASTSFHTVPTSVRFCGVSFAPLPHLTLAHSSTPSAAGTCAYTLFDPTPAYASRSYHRTTDQQPSCLTDSHTQLAGTPVNLSHSHLPVGPSIPPTIPVSQPISPTAPTSYAMVKLPKISMKQFNGDLTKWVSFWDTFNSTIHSNPNLSDVDKFTYLLSLLDSSAADAVAGLTLSSANYEEAMLL